MSMRMRLHFSISIVALILEDMQIIRAAIMKFFAVLRGRGGADTPPERLRRDVGLEASERTKGWWHYR